MDTNNERLMRFWSSNLTYNCKWGTSGSGYNQFSSAYDVCINDTQQNLWVIDTYNDRIVKRRTYFNRP